MGGGGKTETHPIYQPTKSGQLESQLYGMATSLARDPSQLPQVDYSGMQNMLRQGQLYGGQKVPTYQAGQAFGFTDPNIGNIPAQAYAGVLSKGREGIQQGQQSAAAQAAAAMGSRGLGRGGLFGAQQAGLARQAMEQQANLARDVAMQQAQEQLSTDKLLAQMNLQRQGMQADENMRRAQQSLAATQAFSNMQAQQLGLMGQMGSARQQQALLPYQLLSDLYKTNVSIAPGQVTQKPSKMSQIGGALAGMGSMAGAFCLPKETHIELENGDTKPVEDIKVGDTVRGGRVTATQCVRRNKDHIFFKHKFDTGFVTMSKGHPYFDKLESMEAVDSNSECTYDILTTEGHYYVNGVKLGSTIRGES